MSTGEWVLAVDLGTTKTRAAYTTPTSREPVEVKIPPEYNTWLPSSVARDPDVGGWLVGQEAERLRTGWTGAFFQNAKLLLGQAEPHYFDGHPFSMLEIVAQPLIQVAAIARTQAGRVFDRLALAAPVQFEGYRSELLVQAGEMAGFPASRISLTSEAEAAARAALGPVPEDGTWLLFDMGGGTLDVALLRARAGGLQILDTFGTHEVSGHVLDSAIMEHLRAEYSIPPVKAAGSRSGSRSRPSSESGSVSPDDRAAQEAQQWRETLLRETAELAKTGVTSRGPGRATLSDPQVRVVLLPKTLQELARPIIDVAWEKCEHLLSENGLDSSEVTALVCAGGSTRSPIIRQLLAAQGVPLRDTAGTPELTVVRGLLTPALSSKIFHPKTIRASNVSGVHHLRTLPASGPVKAVAFSPSGSFLAAACENSVEVWNAADETKRWTYTDHAGQITSLAFARDDTLASSSLDQTIRLRTLGDNEAGQVFNVGVHVHRLAFSPDGSRLVYGSDDNEAHVQAVRDIWTDSVESFTGHEAPVLAAAFSPDGSMLATAAAKSLRLWDAQDGTVKAVLTEHPHPILTLGFAPDSSKVVTACQGGQIRLWNVRSGRCEQALQLSKAVRSVAYSPTGEFLAAADDAGRVELFNSESGESLSTLSGHTGYISSVAFSRDGTLLASGDNKQVIVWGLG